MKLKIFIVDAFTEIQFGGNPAAIVPLAEWLPDTTLQQIAMENNQAETAFFISIEEGYSIRWFTPVIEVALCGHATLAAAHILFTYMNESREKIVFHSKSGPLFVSKNAELYTLDFPIDYFLETELPDKLAAAMRTKPTETFIGKTDYLLVYPYEEIIKRISPDFTLLKEVRTRGVIVTAKGLDVDFVYRFFAPQTGIDEDPATGSAQTTLMPYWSKKLNKTTLTSIQLSNRLGIFQSSIIDNRILISGKAITYLQGEIEL